MKRLDKGRLHSLARAPETDMSGQGLNLVWTHYLLHCRGRSSKKLFKQLTNGHSEPLHSLLLLPIRNLYHWDVGRIALATRSPLNWQALSSPVYESLRGYLFVPRSSASSARAPEKDISCPGFESNYRDVFDGESYLMVVYLWQL